YMERALEQLAAALEDAPQRPVRTLEVLPPGERMLLLATWNQTDAVYPRECCLHQLFEEQARRTPDAIAVMDGALALTYAVLNRRAHRLAHALIGRGVVPDARVALCVARPAGMVVGLLAILKAGGAYVPLDPTYPRPRLHALVRDAGPVLVLCDAAGRGALGPAAPGASPVVTLEPSPAGAASALDADPQVPGLTCAHLAYVIYTSGSTGTPKGVLVEHAQIVRLFEATQAWYRFDPQDV